MRYRETLRIRYKSLVVRKVISGLGLLTSIMAIVKLIALGRDRISAPLQAMLDWYSHVIDFLFSWAEPYLRYALTLVHDWTNWDLQLYPHWKHALVAMWLYFGANAQHDLKTGRWANVAVAAFWGFVVALVASVASGTVALDDPSRLSIIYPVVGFVLYQFGQTLANATFYPPKNKNWWQTFFYYFLWFVLLDAVIGCAIIVISDRETTVRGANILLFIAFVIAIAIRNIVRGAWIATFERKSDEPWIRRFNNVGSAHFGLVILSAVLGAIITIALNTS